MAKLTAIKEKHLFSRAYSKGKCVSGTYFSVYVMNNYKGPTKLGITVSKKLGCAVRRNRVKRVVRAAMREIMAQYGFARPFLIVVVARSRAYADGFGEKKAKAELEALLGRLGAFASEQKE